jgi:hypothetical protein
MVVLDWQSLRQLDSHPAAALENEDVGPTHRWAGSGFKETDQFDSDLFQAPFVCLAFLPQQRSYFRRELHLSFGVLLKFQIHHFFD